MSSGAKQLSEDFKQVLKLLETYPDIKIIKTDGDPPEQYDIEYTIKGYKTDHDGTPSPDNNHEVRISLPFGYPHFPPTAKPITPIFHPDIDPDAIRIADFWQDNHSLSNLIVHIGQMICGNHYTKDDPFNQSAFEWFEERKSWLPFDILEPRDEDEALEKAGTEAAGTGPSDADAPQSFAPATDLDILKDDIDFPFGDDEESGEHEDEISFAIEEDSVSDDLSDLDGDEPSDEINLDFGDEKSAESFDLQETEDSAIDDLFSLDTDEIGDDFSFDLVDEPDEVVSVDETPPTDDLFELETEPAGDESGDEGAILEIDSEDITSAFEEDANADTEGSEAGDITLDDLAGLEEQEDTLDFGIADESMDIGSGTTADLSALAEETGEETEPESDETGAEEEKILSALSLDEDPSSPDKAGDKSQVIQSLIDQKQIFSAKKVLADLPDPNSLSDKKELELTITGAVSEAEELFKKADKHEQKGEFEKAGLLLDIVANIATDFPGLDFARNRIRESMMDAGKKKPAAATDEKKAAHAQEGETETSAPKKKARVKLSFKVPTRLIVTLVIVVLLGGIGTGGMYVYNNDSKSIHLATKAFQKAEHLIESKKFKGAQKELDSAWATLKKILIFQGAKKEALTRQVTDLTNSSLLKEGLKGRVLYGDQYVSVETAKAIDKFNTQKKYAEQVLKSGKLEQAITALEKSLPYAEKARFEDQVESINRKIIELRLELAMAQAKQSEEEQNWLNAEKSYRNALELSKNISSQEVQDDIANRLATASYHYALHEGLKTLNNAEWQKSIDAFQSVQKILRATPQIVPETERTEANKLLIQSHLYLQLAEAKKAYENKEWDRALDIYSDTVILLKTNTNLFGKESADNIKKIEKTILTTHVARKQVQIAIARSENALDKTVEYYEAIAKLIGDSAFKDDETLTKILDDARIKTTEIKKQLLISKREKWLMDNYEKIFRDNYPSAEQSDLMNPKVRFIKREGNIMIFNMSCTERKQGRQFRLELNYQHNLDKDTWTMFSGKIE